MTAVERTALDAGFHIIVPVWGSEYTRIFVDLLLPTLLAPGNIPALPHRERHIFQIYTTPADRAVIEASPGHARLKQHMRVAFHRVRAHPGKGGNAYAIQSDCYRRAIREADAADQAMVFLTPDLVMADGSLRNLARIAASGVRAVLGVGVRLVKEAVGDALLRHHRSADGEIAIGPRELVRLALPNIHPIAKAHFYRDEGHGLFLSNLYWRVAAGGLLARCFHLHPFMVYPRVKNAPFSSTVDGDYIETACPDPVDTYVITDSDEFCAFELSAGDRRIPVMERSRPPQDFVRWIYNRTTPRHRLLIANAIRLHTGVADAAAWQAASVEAEDCVKRLLSYVEIMAQAEGSVAGTGYVARKKTAPVLHFLTLVRDAAEARLFLDVALPSVIAPGGIPRFPNKLACRWRIGATPEAGAVIAASPGFAELREHVRGDIEIIGDAAARDPRFPAEHRQRVIREAAAAGAGVFFVDHDTVLADESFGIITRVIELGFRAILMPRLRLRRSTAAPALRDGFWVEGLLSIASRELVRLAMEHLDAREIAGNEAILLDPPALAWRVGSEGIVVHCLASDPIMVYPRPGLAPAARVADEPFLASLGLAENEVSLVQEANTMTICRLADDAEPHKPARDLGELARWAAARTGLYQREVFKNPFIFPAESHRGPLWPVATAKAATAVLQVLSEIEAASADAMPRATRRD